MSYIALHFVITRIQITFGDSFMCCTQSWGMPLRLLRLLRLLYIARSAKKFHDSTVPKRDF